MVDVLTPEQRRFNMSRIRGGNTKPEMLLRSALHARGLRFRLHRRDLPGCPDIIFPASKTAVFVDGCFWHGCPVHSTKPKSNGPFWKDKLRKNKERDREVGTLLRADGWTVMRWWEHEIEHDIARVVACVFNAVKRSPQQKIDRCRRCRIPARRF
jgi:DNA mismatch endonuclease, patch repair protein